MEHIAKAKKNKTNFIGLIYIFLPSLARFLALFLPTTSNAEGRFL
jgi:hypothetical protein